MNDIFTVFKSLANEIGIEPALSLMLAYNPQLNAEDSQGREELAKSLAKAGILLEDGDIATIAKSLPDIAQPLLQLLDVQKSKGKKTENIPVSKLKWVHRPKERKELKKEGKVKFLGKNDKGEPCCPYTNKDGTINCRMVHAAEVRATQHGHKEAAAKAKRIYAKNCAKKKSKS